MKASKTLALGLATLLLLPLGGIVQNAWAAGDRDLNLIDAQLKENVKEMEAKGFKVVTNIQKVDITNQSNDERILTEASLNGYIADDEFATLTALYNYQQCVEKGTAPAECVEGKEITVTLYEIIDNKPNSGSASSENKENSGKDNGEDSGKDFNRVVSGGTFIVDEKDKNAGTNPSEGSGNGSNLPPAPTPVAPAPSPTEGSSSGESGSSASGSSESDSTAPKTDPATSEETKANPAQPDEAKPNPTTPNPAKPDGAKPDGTKTDGTKTEGTKPGSSQPAPGTPATPPVSKLTFNDIDTYPFKLHIEWLAAQGITRGYRDGGFHPHESVSREAMAAFLYRLSGQPAYTAPKTSPFTDVQPGDAFYQEICWLAQTGITTGYKDGSFRPQAAINRDAMAAFLKRYNDNVAKTKLTLQHHNPVSFNDTQDNIFASHIEWLAQTGITTGYSDGSYRPLQAIERGAIAAFFYRMRTL